MRNSRSGTSSSVESSANTFQRRNVSYPPVLRLIETRTSSSSPCFLRVADASAASSASKMISLSTPFSLETASTASKISLFIDRRLLQLVRLIPDSVALSEFDRAEDYARSHPPRRLSIHPQSTSTIRQTAAYPRRPTSTRRICARRGTARNVRACARSDRTPAKRLPACNDP